MKRDYIIDYLSIAMELYKDENQDEILLRMWEDVKLSFEDEEYNKGIYLLNIEDGIIFSIKYIKNYGHPFIDNPKNNLHKKIKKAWKEFIYIYSS